MPKTSTTRQRLNMTPVNKAAAMEIHDDVGDADDGDDGVMKDDAGGCDDGVGNDVGDGEAVVRNDVVDNDISVLTLKTLSF